MANIPFPNVPNVPGVPALPRSPNFPPVAQAAISAIQGIIWRVFQVGSQWGVFDAKGNALGDPKQFTGLTGDATQALGIGATNSFNSIDYAKETRASDFPVEQGSFASYNKVETPANPLVTLCFSGSEADRKTFLDAIDKAANSTDLYSVVTPEKTYINFTIERYNYTRRNSAGRTLLRVDLSLKEVRQVSSLYSTSNKPPITAPKQPSATSTTDSGKVQAKTPRTSALNSLKKALPALKDKIDPFLKGIFK